MENTKALIYQLCLKFVEQRIDTAQTALTQAREASNDDTKSSAGDKYETSREMMQQDIERNKRLLIDAQENLKMLHHLADTPPSVTARSGSLIYTNHGNFYLSISAGQLHLKNDIFFAISGASPIGKLLLGKQKGDAFNFNGKQYQIHEVI